MSSKSIGIWNKKNYVNSEIFTYINVEMDLFLLGNSFQHTRIYPTALGSPAEEEAMLNSGLLLTSLWLEKLPGWRATQVRRPKDQKTQKLCHNYPLIRKCGEHS